MVWSLNSSGNVPELTGATTTGYLTYDLYVQLEPGDTVTYQDSGIMGGNMGIRFHKLFGNNPPPAEFFQHPTGGDSQTEVFGYNTNVIWDTRGQMGDLGIGEYAELAPVIWDGDGIIGAWAPTGAQPASPTDVVGPNSYWFGRFTFKNVYDPISWGPMYGEIFLTGTGPNGDFGTPDNLESGIVSFGVPSPGAAALLIFPCFTLARRRRTAPHRATPRTRE